MSKGYGGFTNFERWAITIGVMIATLMQVIDVTIVNVALPHMQGSLGTTPDQISWVLTSYLVSSAILMPLTGFFTDKFGRKRFLMVSIIGFTIASVLCGAATSLVEIVIFRLLQGFFGAALIPMSQTILTDIYPPEERGKAMAIWGIGVMVGPVLGPTIGGYLTDVASWRWNFYINIPFGIIALALIWHYLPETERKERRLDWFGFILISVSIAALQYFLDRGNYQDWFYANDIRIAAFLAVTCFVGFLIYSFNGHMNSVFELRIFQDRNFAVSGFLIAAFGLGLFGTMVILPLMLENLLNYPVLKTGLVMAPRGISSMISMIIVGKLVAVVDPRKLIIIGIVFCTIGSFLGTYYNIGINPYWVMMPFIIQGFGFGFIFVPLSALALSTLPANLRAEASGMFSLLRTIGSSIGISLVITVYTRLAQISWNEIGGAMNPYNPAFYEYLNAAKLTMSNPVTPQLLGMELSNQSQMMAFVDDYVFIAWSFVIMLPFVFLLKKPAKVDVPSAAE